MLVGRHCFDYNTDHMSRRLAEKRHKELQAEKLVLEQSRQNSRRIPQTCSQCTRQSRPGSVLCRVCYTSAPRVTQQNDIVICQGCPKFIRGSNLIRWAKEHPELAFWLQRRLHLSIERTSSHNGPRRLCVLGWFGATELEECRDLDGTL
jgi:hypothetical protein